MKGARIPCEKTATMDIRPTGSAVVWSAKVLAQQEAEQMLSSARERAGAIAAEARQEAVAIRERAVEEGRGEGFQRVAAEVAEAVRFRTQAQEEHLPDLIRLATRMAERIVRSELATRPEVVMTLCRGVIRESRAGQTLTIQVHPEDLATAREHRVSMAKDLGVDLHFEVSSEVSRGGCVVHGERGRVDGRLEVQLEQLAAIMRGGEDESFEPG